jgi:uncharacterized SAM-dependent methyltransferase
LVANEQVDLDGAELERTLSTLESTIPRSVSFLAPSLEDAKGSPNNKVAVAGLHASYDSALPFISTLSSGSGVGGGKAQKSLLWLGSSIGNFTRNEGAKFLRRYAEAALGPGETILIGIDHCDDGDKIRKAYDDSHGVTRRFVLNGVKNFMRILGVVDRVADDAVNKFEYVSRWNGPEGRHEVRSITIRLFHFSQRGGRLMCGSLGLSQG